MMKKLFTSLLLLGVTLCSWAVLPPGDDFDGVLEVSYEEFSNANGNFEPSIVKAHMKGKVTRLVLTGAFSNADFNDQGKVNDLVKLCCGDNGKLYLDMEGCTGVVSKVRYTGEGTEDYTSKHFEYDYSSRITVNVSQQDVYVTEHGHVITEQWAIANLQPTGTENQYTLDNYWDGTSQNGHTVTKTTAWGYTDNGNFVIVPDESVNTSNQTATIDQVLPAFSFGVNGGSLKDRINGVTFPNDPKFKAIPDNLCNGLDLTKVVIDFDTDYIIWIGKNAFRFDPVYTVETETINGVQVEKPGTFQATKVSHLANVSFPETLKVIGVDAFYGCTAFTSVNLSDLDELVRIDAAAFNMVRTELNELSSVTLPTATSTKPNETLRFFANQVFSSSHITSLDFTYFDGITHFAYDGADSMGESTYNPDGSGFSGSATFAWYADLQTLTLPRNLLYVAGGDENSGILAHCASIQTINFPGTATFDSETAPTKVTNKLVIGDGAFQNIPSLKTVTFAENSNLSVIGEDAFNKCTGIETVSMGGIAKFDASCNVINPVTIKKNAFLQNTSLKNLTLSNNVTYIGEAAFDQTSQLQEVHIPASVQTIKYKAFNECPSLTTVYFDDTVCPNCDNVQNMPTMLIEGYAFMLAQNVMDVYVNNRTPITCENKAFAFDITFGQSNVNNNMATLHYPEGQEEHYTNLSHYLTDEIANNPGLFQAWLVEHFAVAQDPPAQNGWYEFVNSGPSKTIDPDDPEPDPEFPGGVILRTFSEVRYACLVPEGIKAFVVNSVKKTADGNSYELTLYPVQVIPAKTGVILYGQPNATDSYGNPTLSMTPVRFAPVGETVTILGETYTVTTEQGKPYRHENWKSLDNSEENKKKDPFSNAQMTEREKYKNYLMPTSDDDGNPLDLGPTERDANGNVIFRNFAMQRYSKTKNLSSNYPIKDINNDFVGFFRCLKNPNKWPAGYAYLRLSAVEDASQDLEKEFTESTGAEIIVKEFGNYFLDFKKGDQSGSLVDHRPDYWSAAVWANPLPNWGNRSTAFSGAQPQFIFTGEMEEETDGVVTLTIPANESEEGEYYTLQGVKVNKPVKGIYIHNGKKVVIK